MMIDSFTGSSFSPSTQRYSPGASPKATGPVRIQPIGLIAQPEPGEFSFSLSEI